MITNLIFLKKLEIFIIDSVFKINPWTLTTFKIKDLNGEKIKGSFHGKE